MGLAQAGEGGGWTVLLDGKNLDAFRYKQGGWHIDDEGAVAWRKKAGYLWTKERFGDFVLDLEFKVSKGCNSGIFIRTANLRKIVQTGIEVQILDSHGKKNVGQHDCGAIYDCLAPSANAVKKPLEWNHITIAAKDNIIQVTLNGTQIIDMDLDKWDTAKKNPDGSKNKFRTPLKDFKREGHIGFQDHGKPVWFRNIRIKVLDEEK
jgi:hypothetical protein